MPLAIAALAAWAAPRKLGPALQMALTLAIVVPLGPMLYRIAYRPLANASVLVLFIVSMAAHYVLTGLGLVIFGGEGLRSNAISDAKFDVGVLHIGAQSLWVAAASVICMTALWLFFERTLYGKALRATALNRVGARLVGIPTALAGSLAFLLAAAIGALSGILISPITTIYYDTGLMIGLKGFVGAILGGMASYPLAALGAAGRGLARVIRVVLGQFAEGNHRLHDHHPGAVVALAGLAPSSRRGRGRMSAAGPFPRRELPLAGLSPDTSSPVVCWCLAKGRATGTARPARPARSALGASE